jgi:hypothetical protein
MDKLIKVSSCAVDVCGIYSHSIQKLRKEIFIWQQLEHLHILPLYGTTDGFDSIPALVCPWMKNGSLQQYLKKMRHEQLPLEMHRLFSLVSILVHII